MCRTYKAGGLVIWTITQALLIFGTISTNVFTIYYWFWQWPELQALLYVIFNGAMGLAWLSHLAASFQDPGTVPKMEPPDHLDPSEVRYCKKCPKQWKPERAHHCSECNKCIFKMDHHCPWVNNCTGEWNFKSFTLFTAYTCLGSFLSIALHITCFVFLMMDEEEKHMKDNAYYKLCFIVSVLTFFEALLFSLFTFELTKEMAEMFLENRTYIDDMKDLTGRPLGTFEGF